MREGAVLEITPLDALAIAAAFYILAALARRLLFLVAPLPLPNTQRP